MHKYFVCVPFETPPRNVRLNSWSCDAYRKVVFIDTICAVAPTWWLWVHALFVFSSPARRNVVFNDIARRACTMAPATTFRRVRSDGRAGRWLQYYVYANGVTTVQRSSATGAESHGRRPFVAYRSCRPRVFQANIVDCRCCRQCDSDGLSLEVSTGHTVRRNHIRGSVGFQIVFKTARPTWVVSMEGRGLRVRLLLKMYFQNEIELVFIFLLTRRWVIATKNKAL